MKKIIVICFLILSFVSCKQNHDDLKKVNARVFIESDKNTESIIKVFLEDRFGNALTGAKIICVDKNNRASLLEFDALKYYYWVKTELPSLGDVKIYIQSNALKKEKKLVVPHEKILKLPKLIAFQDISGKSVLKGEDISSQEDIQIAWESMGANCIYTLEIKTSVDTVYSYATNACNIIISSNTLKANKNYYLVLTVQKYSGDPLFKNYNYYSLSSTQTGGINFVTK